MIALFLAALLSGVWLLVHLFLGGREVAMPLRQGRELDPLVRDVLYLCWHFTSVAIAAMSLAFALGALGYGTAFGVFGVLLASGFALVGIFLVQKIGQSHLKAPQGWLFVPVALLGLWGVLQ